MVSSTRSIAEGAPADAATSTRQLGRSATTGKRMRLRRVAGHGFGFTHYSFTTHQHAQTRLKPSVKVEHLAHVTAASFSIHSRFTLRLGGARGGRADTVNFLGFLKPGTVESKGQNGMAVRESHGVHFTSSHPEATRLDLWPWL